MTDEQFNAHLNHIDRVYEDAKSGAFKNDMKAVLDGLQELRNICCEFLQKLTPHQPMSTAEGNKLICEFLGWKTSFNELGFQVPNLFPITLTADDRRSTGWMDTNLDEMQFHDRWDWQIPVWSKLVTGPLREFILETSNSDGEKYNRIMDDYAQSVRWNKPQEGFNILAQAIKWLNKNKPQ